jgi:hypothetical protein
VSRGFLQRCGINYTKIFAHVARLETMKLVCRLLRYIQRTVTLGLRFPAMVKEKKNKLIGFSNSNWCWDKVEIKSTSRYVFKYNDGAISWCTKKQLVTALFSCEA